MTEIKENPPEIIKGDNYILQFEDGGLRLEIFDGDADDVFGELSKNTRLISYEELTLTVFPVRIHAADNAAVFLFLRINQTDDGFDEEGSFPYSEKVLAAFKKHGVKIVNEELLRSKPKKGEKPEKVFKIYKRVALKTGLLCAFGALLTVYSVLALCGVLPFHAAPFSIISFLIIGVSVTFVPDSMQFYNEYFGYATGSVPRFFVHKKSIEAISVLTVGGKPVMAAFFLPSGVLEMKCGSKLFSYITENLKEFVPLTDVVERDG